MQAAIRELYPIPEGLQDIPVPPGRLWIRGMAPEAAGIAIVGSRKPTAYGRRTAAQLAGRVGAGGMAVISGLAFGVDTIAHTSALEAGGRTVAVLPTGLADEDVTPRHNVRLARQIATAGTLLSEYPPGTPSRKYHYEARNRLISGLAKTVVVVEASRPSGTLITARHAGEQGRDVWAVPGPIDSDQSLGTNWLIDQGATPLLSIDGFLEANGITGPKPSRRGLAALLTGTTHFDELVVKSGKPAAAVEAELTRLELAGTVRHLGDRYYARV